MGQHELIELLKSEKDWLLAIEIRSRLKLAPGAVNRLIKILVESGEIIAKPAIDVITDEDRLKRTTVKARAYRIKK